MGSELLDLSGWLWHYEKHPVIYDIWRQAGTAIKNCDELIIVGYSFPQTDNIAESFLGKAVRGASVSAIKVVDPDPTKSLAKRIEGLFGKKVDWVESSFENWIDSVKV